MLPRIVERVLSDGGRLLVVTEDAAQAESLDELLWSFAPESFVPHARAGAADDAAQPVLIASLADPLNGARNLLIADGLWRGEAARAFDRTFLMFDEEHVQGARAAWRELDASTGVDRRYWKQDDGGAWQQLA